MTVAAPPESNETGHPTLPPDLLPAVSRSFHLSLRFLPGDLRTPLGLAYLLARTSDSLADDPRVPLALRLESLEAFQQAIDSLTPFSLQERFPELQLRNPAEQRLAEHSGTILAQLSQTRETHRREIQTLLRIILGGQIADLARFGYASAERPAALRSADELHDYTYRVAGCVGEFWTRLCALTLPGWPETRQTGLLQHGRLFGQGLQLVNILRDLPEDLAAGRCYLPAEELDLLQLRPKSLRQNPAAARPLIFRWMQQAQEWLQQGALYERLIPGIRLRFSVSLPRRIGLETLNALRTHPPLETPTRVKIPRSKVLFCAARSLLGAFKPSPELEP